MDDLLKDLQEKGSQIVQNPENAYGTPYVLDLDFDSFASLFNIINQSFDNNELIIGFCHSLSSYIVINYENLTEDMVAALWEFLSILIVNIDYYPAMIFIAESVYFLVMRSHSPPDDLLHFLISFRDEDGTMLQQNNAIKPIILAYISRFLPPRFLCENDDVSSYFLSILKIPFKDAPVTLKTNIIDLITRISPTEQELMQNEELKELIWNHIISLSTRAKDNESDYMYLCKNIYYFRNKCLIFFTEEHHLLINQLEKLDSCLTNDAKVNYFKTTILYFLPFMSLTLAKQTFETFVPILNEYIQTKGHAPDLHDCFRVYRIKNTVSLDVMEQIRLFLKSVCENDEIKEAALFIFSCLIGISPDHIVSDCSFVNSKVTGLALNDQIHPNVLLSIVGNLLSYPDVIRTQLAATILPKIMTFLAEGDVLLIKNLFIVLRKAAYYGFDLSREILSILFEFVSSAPSELYKELFDVFYEIASNADDLSKIVEKYVEFFGTIFHNPDVPLLIKGESISIIDIFYDIPDIMADFIDPVFDASPLLFTSGNYSLYLDAAFFINDCITYINDFSDYAEIITMLYTNLIKIADEIENVSARDKTKALVEASKLNRYVNKQLEEKIDNFIVPFTLLEKFANSNQEDLSWRCISIVGNSLQFYSSEDVLKLYLIFAEKCKSEDFSYLNSLLKLSVDIMQSINVDEEVPQPILNFILSVTLGRYKIYDGEPLIDHFCKDLELYQAHYQLISHGINTFVPHLLSTLRYIQPIFYGQISQSILFFIEHNEVDEIVLRNNIWDTIGVIISENLEQVLYLHYLVRIMNSICIKLEWQIDIIDYFQMLNAILSYIIDDQEKESSIYFEYALGYLLCLLNSPTILPVNINNIKGIFETIESFEWSPAKANYQDLLNITCDIYEKNIKEYKLDKYIVEHFALLLLTPQEELEKYEIESLDRLVDIIRNFAERRPKSTAHILQKFDENQQETLKEIIGLQ